MTYYVAIKMLDGFDGGADVKDSKVKPVVFKADDDIQAIEKARSLILTGEGTFLDIYNVDMRD